MVSICDNSDIELVKNYIGNQYYKSLYLYLDFLKFGLSCDYVTTWIQRCENRVTSIVLKYKTGLHIFSKENNFDVDELCSLIISLKPDMICSSKDTIDFIDSKLKCKSYLQETGYVGMFTSNGEKELESLDNIFDATKADFPQIIDLLYQDEGIGASYEKGELSQQMYERNMQGFSRNCVIKDGEQVISHICTGAENEDIAVVSGVVTAFSCRGRGLASSLIRVFCKRLREEGKKVYSIYYTSAAQKTHHKAGFVDVCEYGKLFLKKKRQ